jgi:hypothetical protein
MATLKTLTAGSVKFFLKNPATTAAFKNTTFSLIYPNSAFNNSTPVNLVTLSNENEIKPPTLIGAALFGDDASALNKVESTTAIFNTCAVGDYILFDNGGGPDDLQVLGQILTITTTGGDAYESVTLVKNSTFDSGATAVNIYILSLASVGTPFKVSEPFYMVVKNPNMSSARHDGILSIETLINAPNVDLFGYGGIRTINPTYFKFRKISKVHLADEGLDDTEIAAETNIMCTVTGVSTLSYQFQEPELDIADSDIPYWSVYEINPYGDSTTYIDKSTIYRIEIDNPLPFKAILVSGTTSTE